MSNRAGFVWLTILILICVLHLMFFTQDALKARTLVNPPTIDQKIALSALGLFDKEIRRVYAVVKDAYVEAGENDFASWFLADFSIRGRQMVLSYDRWEDGKFYWNLQENTDVADGPDGVADLKRSKVFGVVLRYVANLVNAA